MALELFLADDDIARFADGEERRVLQGERAGTLGASRSKAVVNVVSRLSPKALAAEIERMCPDLYAVSEIRFKIVVKGAPWGVGLDGSGEVVLKRSDAT